ncbi:MULTISPECIES: hypothetical protein [Nostocaceae]|nr:MULTISPECIES: hypothetical protein [Nostocaceae]
MLWSTPWIYACFLGQCFVAVLPTVGDDRPSVRNHRQMHRNI